MLSWEWIGNVSWASLDQQCHILLGAAEELVQPQVQRATLTNLWRMELHRWATRVCAREALLIAGDPPLQ